jgi:exopolysaccharide production protein ExoQ
MSPNLTLLIVALGTAGLFFLDRDSTDRPSKALWLPVIWLLINGSRPLSVWFDMSSSGALGVESAGSLPSTSLLDQLVASVLMVLGVVIVARRGREVGFLLKASWPITIYFLYCFTSVLWSDFADWGLKRWIRAVGELVMVLIPVTESQLIPGMKHLFSRVGFILLPASVLLIKYFPNLGRGYDDWGLQVNVGVTTNKNLLGAVAFILTLGALWQILLLIWNPNAPNRKRHLLAQGILLCFGIEVLILAHSATAGACFVLGAALMVVTTSLQLFKKPAAMHALVLCLLLSGGAVYLMGGSGEVVKAMGRKSDLTGRTRVWQVVVPMAPNVMLGAGFETFWLGERAAHVRTTFNSFINEAHNGYIEVYLNLGLIGVGLIALILIQGYIGAVSALRYDRPFVSLLLTYILTAAIYNATEAGYRMLSPIWFFLLLAVVSAKAVIRRYKLAAQPQRKPHGADLGFGPPARNSQLARTT